MATGMERFVVISGCSGGGKSTLLRELGKRGYATVAEPGRRIVREGVLPWVDPAAFARRAVEVARADWKAAEVHAGWVFFDRGLIDAAVALEHATTEPAPETLGLETVDLETVGRAHRYHARVFLAPPWPEIYAGDVERRHDFAAAVAEYARLGAAYPRLGYETVILPKVSVADRAAFLLRSLGAPP